MAQSTITDSGFDIALSILRRRKWTGVIAFVATLSLAAPFVVFLPDIYRGVTTVIVENQDASSSVVRGPVPELETRLITIQQELLSRGRLSDLIKQLNLYPSWRRTASVEAIVQRMRRDIRVDPSRTDRGRPTTIGLKISYIGLDAKSAAAVPNALATMYVEENTRIRERQTGQMADFLKTQLATAQQAVDVQHDRLNRFKEQRAGQLPEQVSINLVAVERLNTRLRLNAEDQLKIRDRQDRLADGRTAVDDAAPDPLLALKQRLAELESKFTDRHPDVIRTRAQIAEMERLHPPGETKPVRTRAVRADNSEAELAALQREERSLRADIAMYEQRIQAAPKVEQELEGLERDYNGAKESFASILKRFEEAQLAERLEQTKTAESVRILDAAVVPAFPAAPNRMRLMIMAGFFAVASAVGSMLIKEHLDTSFHTVGELRQFTTVPVLGSIPYVATRPTFGSLVRVVLFAIAVAGFCVLLAGFAYRTARENTQLVWMLSAPQL